MKVLMVAMKWDYGSPSRGLSFEHTNMYDAMRHMDGVDVELFDFMSVHQAGGSDGVRRELTAAVKEHDPDLLFAVTFKDELPDDVLADLRDRPRPITFNWFCDDHWRFDNYTRHMAPLFNACSTTATSALPKYAKIGYSAVIKTQWACNHHLYRPTGRPLSHGVTFVGQPHGRRREVIERLSKRGIEVETWGMGWETGRLDQADMVSLFAESRINLNLSNASTGSLLRRVFASRLQEQIKGRNFEIPGCGGFQLSGRADDLDAFFEPGVEIAIFGSEDDLADSIRRYLADDGLRNAIAERGYRRTIAQHTYAHRFEAIFDFLDLR